MAIDEELILEKTELDVDEPNELLEEIFEPLVRPKSLWPKIVARVLIVVMILGMGLTFVRYQARNQVTFGDFAFENGAYRYEDIHFEIISYDYLDDLNLEAINDLYYKYDDILDMMDHQSMPKLQLRFYGNRDDYLQEGIYSRYVGYYKEGVIRVLNPKAKGVDDYTDYGKTFSSYGYTHTLLPHEFVHAVHDDKIGAFPKNRWISEGIANYISYKLIGINWHGVKDAYEGQPIKPHSFNAFDHGYEYDYGFTIIDYLVETYGNNMISKIIEEPQLDEEARIMKLTGMKPDEFYNAWEAFMIDQYKMLPAVR